LGLDGLDDHRIFFFEPLEGRRNVAALAEALETCAAATRRTSWGSE